MIFWPRCLDYTKLELSDLAFDLLTRYFDNEQFCVLGGLFIVFLIKEMLLAENGEVNLTLGDLSGRI